MAMAMEQEQGGQLNAYRERLLETLHERPYRQCQEEPDALQVFVNHQRLGTLECDRGSTALVSVSHPRPIRVLEVRTATGFLVAGLWVEEADTKMARFPVGKHTIEVSVHNQPDQGSFKVAYRAAAPWWQRVLKKATAVTASLSRPGSFVFSDQRPFRSSIIAGLRHIWPKAAVVAQGLIAVGVLLLVADRVMGPFGIERTAARVAPNPEPSGITRVLPNEALARQEQMLLNLTQGQKAAMRTLRAQQMEIVRLHRAMAEQKQMREQIQQLTAERGSLTNQVTVLEARTRELEQSRNEQALALAKAPAPQLPEKPTVGESAMTAPLSTIPSAQVAEVRHEHPVTFWVSFQEGTSEENIESLIHDIHGRRGPNNAGWYNVEVNLPQPQTPDRFFESLKKAKIVKAVTTSLNTPPGQ